MSSKTFIEWGYQMAKTARQSDAGFRRYKLLKSVMVLSGRVLSGRSCVRKIPYPVRTRERSALARNKLWRLCVGGNGGFTVSQFRFLSLLFFYVPDACQRFRASMVHCCSDLCVCLCFFVLAQPGWELCARAVNFWYLRAFSDVGIV